MSVKALDVVWRHYPVGGGELLLLLAMADWANDAGEGIWPAVPAMARKARLSDRQVQRLLRELQKNGVIERAGATEYGTTKYCLRFDRLAAMPEVWCARRGGDVTPGDKMSPGDISSKNLDKMSQKTTPMSPKPFTPFTPFSLSAAAQEKSADQEVVAPGPLPGDWSLPSNWDGWARQARPELAGDMERMAGKFKAYWTSRTPRTPRGPWETEWRLWVARERSAPQKSRNGGTNYAAHQTTHHAKPSLAERATTARREFERQQSRCADDREPLGEIHPPLRT